MCCWNIFASWVKFLLIFLRGVDGWNVTAGLWWVGGLVSTGFGFGFGLLFLVVLASPVCLRSRILPSNFTNSCWFQWGWGFGFSGLVLGFGSWFGFFNVGNISFGNFWFSLGLSWGLLFLLGVGNDESFVGVCANLSLCSPFTLGLLFSLDWGVWVVVAIANTAFTAVFSPAWGEGWEFAKRFCSSWVSLYPWLWVSSANIADDAVFSSAWGAGGVVATASTAGNAVFSSALRVVWEVADWFGSSSVSLFPGLWFSSANTAGAAVFSSACGAGGVVVTELGSSWNSNFISFGNGVAGSSVPPAARR